MPGIDPNTIDPRITALKSEVTGWRRDLHAHPEILYDLPRTSGVVAEKLRSFGLDEVVTGIGQTGVIGVIRGKTNKSGKVIALRADMDALPLSEETNLPHASKTPGKMHACGHDGHTAMLLGAAKHLAMTRDFDGTVITVFQPAEEGGAGALAMLNDGIVERFGIQQFYGMHTMPGVKLGDFSMRPGPTMAATVQFTIDVEGRGAHAAQPHAGVDTVVIGAHIITALQTIASRTVDPLKSVVVSVTQFRAGDAFNIIPQSVTLKGTVRFLDKRVGEQTEERFRAIVDGTAKMFGGRATIDYHYGYPATVNHVAETAFAAGVARGVASSGPVGVDVEAPPMMGGEDFSYMLEARPGSFVFIGNGNSAGLHNPGFDFNDDAIPYGMSYWAGLVRTAMPA